MTERANRVIANISKRVISLRSGLIYALFAFMLAIALTGGVTNAWFTAGDHTENIFTAGTLDLEVEGPVIIGAGSFNRGGYIESKYIIKNSGSKKIYVRASFSGYWKRGFHKNTATATVIYNGQTISVSDSAYYSFANYEPPFDPAFQQEATFGFYDDFITLPVPLPSVTPQPVASTAGFVNSGTAEVISNDLAAMNNDLAVMASYPEPCNGPLVTPISGCAVTRLITKRPDPDPNKLAWPDGCTNRYTFKINADQGQIAVGVPYRDATTGFSATIYKETINGKSYFSFYTNYPVYYVYAKGGSNEGNFYQYFLDERFQNGVYADCGLSQPGGDWSHITFYYCIPPANPSLALKKFVSLDGGNTWADADQAPGLPINPPAAPRFKFVVTNTGNVPLSGIRVVDDYFGPIGENLSLTPGTSWEHIIIDDKWAQALSTENITFALCAGQSDWVLHGGYFYYTQPIASAAVIDLCVKIELDANSGAIYDGAQFILYSYFEAVQTTNGLVHQNWIGNPLP